VATQLVLRSFSEGGRVTTENAPFADRNKNFLPFLKTFEIASIFILFGINSIFCNETADFRLDFARYQYFF